MPPRTTLEPVVARVLVWCLATLLLIPAVVISLWLHRIKNEPPPAFREIEGELGSYTFDTSKRSGRTTLFSLTSHEGRFWTQALSRSEVAQYWSTKPTHLRFYVQTNSTYSPIQGDAVKTFGLWVNGKRIQSLDEKMNEEMVYEEMLRWLSVLMYGLAIALVIFGYWHARPKSTQGV
jgi:hypothetical protein